MKSERQLIEESERLLDIAEQVQNDTQPLEDRKQKLKEASDLYHDWYREALGLFEAHKQLGQQQKFEHEYQGSFLSAKILKFLTSGLEPNPIYIQDNPLTEKYLYPFVRCFKEPLIRQCNSLAGLEKAAQNATANAEEVQEVYWNSTIRRILTVFIEKADAAKTTNEKKLTYEYLAIFLVGAIEGLTIIGQDQRGTTEEIDVWVANEATDAFWQRMGGLFIVECKNWGEPVGVQEIRNLKGVMDSKNIQLAILLSKKGVTGDKWHDALALIRDAFKENKYILVLDETDLLEIAGGIPPAKQIKKKYYDLFMKS